MGRVAIVTGATGGLGMEFINSINSWNDIDEIWAIGRNIDKLNTLSSLYSKVRTICADLLDNGMELISDRLNKEHPDVRLLINNAGIGYLGLYEDMDSQKVQNFCNLNCTIPSMLITLVLPYMREGSGILNISSASSFQPNPYLAIYSASKVYLKNLSRALYVELKPKHINVTSVCPGWIDTEMLPKENNGKKIKYTGIISAKKVVSKALKDNLKGKDMSTPGLFSKYFRFYSKVTPTRIVMSQWKHIIRKYM